MPNIEIKAINRDLNKSILTVKRLSTEYLGVLHQIDTYYETRSGRLKVREINDEKFQLIPYTKDYSHGPMKSRYSLLETKNPKELKEILGEILGEVAVVDKKREVFLIDNVRVHFDEVKGLGGFIEFEAVYTENKPEDKIREENKLKELMDLVGITQEDLRDRSYIDYLLDKNAVD